MNIRNCWMLIALLALAGLPAPELQAQANQPTVRRTPTPRRTPIPRRAPATTPQQQPGRPEIQARDADAGARSSRRINTRTVTRGSTRRAPQPGGSAAGASIGGWLVSREQPTLYLRPFNAYVKPDEEFELEVVLSNPRQETFEELALYLEYDPELLKWKSLKDTALREAALEKQQPVCELLQPGLLHYVIRLDPRAELPGNVLLRLKFKALAETRGSVIRFLNDAERPTVLKMGDKELLGGKSQWFDQGLIGARVTVNRSRKDAPDGFEVLLSRGGGEHAVSAADGETSSALSVALGLRIQNQSIAAGDRFDAHVVFNNPEGLPVDRVRLALRFDPNFLQVEDSNHPLDYIRTGVNISDGPYHRAFPFERHLENHVDNEAGTIRYTAATLEPRRLAGAGVIATIHFRALQAADFAPVWFERGPDGALLSEVRAFGENQLELGPGRFNVQGLAMQIIPAAADYAE